MPVPQLLQHELATDPLKRGFDKIADLLAVTLGPTQGVILSKHETRAAPEILSDAATIARRIIALPDRAEDVGAMLARNLVWRQHLRAGDGCATTAVLAQAILRHARAYIAAGGNAMMLRRGIERAGRAAIDALKTMARPAKNEQLAQVAETITGDPKLSALLAEIFTKLGPAAHVTVEDYLAPYLERQYYEGGRFVGRLVSPYFITDSATRRANIADCHVALYAGTVSSIDDIEPLLKIVAETSWHQVALIANEISGTALMTLVLNHQQGKLKILAAELRENETKRAYDFDDLAALTGATILSPETGRPLAKIDPSDLGAAPRVEADADELIVVAGEGDPEAVKRQAAKISARIETLNDNDDEIKDLKFRLARLNGQIAKLMIGAHTEAERNVIHQQAEKAIRALPLALREGVVPGGGVAFLNCIPAVRAVDARGDEAFGVHAIARALEEPFKRIAQNAGLDAPALLIADAQQRGAQFGCDALTGQIVSMDDAGILDSVGVAREALQTAISGAVMALTTETIVLHENPQTSYEP
ncbi:MAG: chaperonin GroEL [Chloroflexi bacterium]|nr:chaperonin GroEL [Chloroflexota bacterium]